MVNAGHAGVNAICEDLSRSNPAAFNHLKASFGYIMDMPEPRECTIFSSQLLERFSRISQCSVWQARDWSIGRSIFVLFTCLALHSHMATSCLLSSLTYRSAECTSIRATDLRNETRAALHIQHGSWLTCALMHRMCPNWASSDLPTLASYL